MERDISKRSLQAAIRHGKKEPAFPCRRTGAPRWKYTYADIVYITDEYSLYEITSYALELPLYREVIPVAYHWRCEEARRRIRADPSIITSHTVMIVDMSGSMGKADMNGHSSRARGVYYNLAEEYIAESLPPINSGLFSRANGHTFTDVVTVLEMRDSCETKIQCEPISWELYNDLVDLAGERGARSHGNYLPAFRAAFEVLSRYAHAQCALSLFFFSDGKPSDFSTSLYGGRFFLDDLRRLVLKECAAYGNRLTFTAFGYGLEAGDFEIMRQIIEFAKLQDCHATFHQSFHDDTELATAISKTRTSLTHTRTLLSRLNLGECTGPRERTDAIKGDLRVEDRFLFNNVNWRIFNGQEGSMEVTRVELVWKNEKGRYVTQWKSVPFQHPDAVGIAVSKAYFGEGAERIVFFMAEIDANAQPAGQSLVAKESLYKHRQQELKYLRNWHRTFVKTQMQAAKLARRFDEKLDRLGVSSQIPRVTFLPCCVYECRNKESGEEYAFLCENCLDPTNYMKWNDNAGGVDGIRRENLRAAEFAPAVFADPSKGLLGKKVEAFEEGDEEEEEDEEEDGEEDIQRKDLRPIASELVRQLEGKVLEVDVPQAFSHFTHRHTKRTMLVCDLQGELKVEEGVPVFKLTDPCIHSNKPGKGYGKTDKGLKGMHDFFKTHHCNAVCRLLDIDNGNFTS